MNATLLKVWLLLKVDDPPGLLKTTSWYTRSLAPVLRKPAPAVVSLISDNPGSMVNPDPVTFQAEVVLPEEILITELPVIRARGLLLSGKKATGV
jgi:hypothetical protein